MEYFLEKIARSLYAEYGNTLNRHCLVFPNRRAGLYFMKYLAAGIEKPVWLPAIFTINDLIRSFSSFQQVSGEILLFELYKVYRAIRKAPESFDDFYFWGDMMLDDFDDIDKYLVNAGSLFSNVLDIKNIDQQFGELTDDQVEIIRKFWVNFNPAKLTKEKTEFKSIWSVLADIYQGFRKSLADQNLAYEGMIFRDIAETRDKDFYQGVEWEKLHFTGFNALNQCEKKIMKDFQNAGKARFYWDYDNSYISRGKLNSAGYFMRENLKMFGNDMPAGWSYDTMLSTVNTSVKRRVIETSSDVAQVKLITELLKQLPDLTKESAHHTAIVLSDENLLMPVLTSLPEDAGDINITMGYPLKHSLIYSLVRQLMDLQRNSKTFGNEASFSYQDVCRILRHSLLTDYLTNTDRKIIKEITSSNLIRVSSERFRDSPYLKRVFTRPETSAVLSGYFKEILTMLSGSVEDEPEEGAKKKVSDNIRNEFIYRVILSLNRLETIISSGEVSFSTLTFMRLFDKLLRTQSVPFSGEPLSGIQIMGILETRALDFRNLIIMSVNEGILPSVSGGSSFIPFSLREAFGLPSINHQESIYAYHFYRLLERAENVTLIYNSNSEGLKSGEMSRFLIQMKYDPLLKPQFTDLNFDIRSHQSVSDRVRRSEEHNRLLMSRFLEDDNRRILSPSAINTWLNCTMKFYYRYICGLKEPESVSEDIDPAMLGVILHSVMKQLYSPFINELLTKEQIEHILRDTNRLESTLIATINEEFGGETDRAVEGNELIIRDVIMTYVRRILSKDKLFAPFRILHLEASFAFPLPLDAGAAGIEVRTGGTIDRIDITEGITRIVDYKTGSVAEKVNSIEDLFRNDRNKDNDAWLQILIYCEAFLSEHPATKLRPSVYKVKKLADATGNDKLRIRTGPRSDEPVEEYQSVRQEFRQNLESTVSGIFSIDSDFIMTSDIRAKCSWCAYKGLCGR